MYLHLSDFRWLYNIGCAYVLATDSRARRFWYRIATVHHFGLWNKWQKSMHIIGFVGNFMYLKTHFIYFMSLAGNAGDGNVSEIVTVIQTSSKYWIFCVSNLFTEYFDCDVIMGIILDKPRSNKCQGCFG